jgi:hypothetical protein
LEVSRPSGLGVDHDTGAASLRQARSQAHQYNSDVSGSTSRRNVAKVGASA